MPALALALLVAALADPTAARSAAPRWDGRRFVVHEWGTFTSVLGSDGVVLGGLTHEDGDLPAFVHDLDHPPPGHSPKMETPVVYVYAPGSLALEVDVSFPRGLITHWFPAASAVNPRPAPGAALRGGSLRWGAFGELLVLPPASSGLAEASPELFPVGDDDPWRFSREVAANALRSLDLGFVPAEGRTGPFEHERCLFYRGLGDFPLPLRARVLHERHVAANAGANGDASGGERCHVRLVLENALPEEPLTHVFLICVRGGRAGFRELADVATPQDLGLVALELAPLAERMPELEERVAAHLAETGLYADEARAMARTWRHAWFGDEGLRLLYVLPPALVERELPLAVRARPLDAPPRAAGELRAPDELVRVFVARTELLAPEREREIERVVTDWVHGDAARRAEAEQAIAGWGRFAPPYLALMRSRAADAGLRAAAQALFAARAR